MPSGRITKRAVESMVPGPGEVFLWDDELRGFGLRVTSRGAKSYILQYRMGGREARTRRFTIGTHGSPWTPDQARKEAARLKILIRQGVDPAQAEQERRRQAVDLAFDAYVQSFTDMYLKRRWKQWKLGAGVLTREVVPVLRDKPLPRIRRSDVSGVWDRLVDRPAVARLTHATLRKLFRWAVSRGDIERSPLEGAEAPPAVPARDRVLSDEELGLLWSGIDVVSAPFDTFFRLLVLTGQRRDEVAGLQWNELDRSEALWTLPGSRTKNRKPHMVPLSGQIVEILDRIAEGAEWPAQGLVLSTTRATPISGFSKPKRKLDGYLQERLGGSRYVHWRVHDLRRTVATGLQRLGVRFEVTEAILNHVGGARSGVAGVYQRYDWLDEKRDALMKWGAHVLAVSAISRAPDVVQ